MSKGLNEKRRELIQTLLIVGGIIGSLLVIRQPNTGQLNSLVLFIITAVFLYALLLNEEKRQDMFYKFAACFVAFTFSFTFFFTMWDVNGNIVYALAYLMLGTVIISLALIRDWDKNKTTRSETRRDKTIPSERKKKLNLEEQDYLFLGIIFSVLAQAMYDLFKTVLYVSVPLFPAFWDGPAALSAVAIMYLFWYQSRKKRGLIQVK